LAVPSGEFTETWRKSREKPKLGPSVTFHHPAHCSYAVLFFRQITVLIFRENPAKIHSWEKSSKKNIPYHKVHYSLKVPKCEILMSWILMIFLS
jgi:hypothetical protein